MFAQSLIFYTFFMKICLLCRDILWNFTYILDLKISNFKFGKSRFVQFFKKASQQGFSRQLLKYIAMITKTYNRPMYRIKLAAIVCCLMGYALQLHAYDPVRNITEYPNLEVRFLFGGGPHDIEHADVICPVDGATISGELRIPGIVYLDFTVEGHSYSLPCTTGKAVHFSKCKDITAVIFESQEIYWNNGYYYDYYSHIAEMEEDSAFYALPKLKYAVIQPKAFPFAFADCPNLERITVIDYGSDADDRFDFMAYKKSFANCSKLTTLECVERLDARDSAFINCTALTLDGVQIYEAGISSFENCTSLTNVTIKHYPILKRAFYGCSNIKSITLDECMFIEEYVFAGCDALTEVRCECMEPPLAYDNSFTTYTATLHVPKGTLEKYKAASGWRNFSNIVDDLEPTSGVASPGDYGITVKSAGKKVVISGNDDNSAVSIYEINGRQIYHGFDNEIQMPAPGIYIVKINNTVQKVMIK